MTAAPTFTPTVPLEYGPDALQLDGSPTSCLIGPV